MNNKVISLLICACLAACQNAAMHKKATNTENVEKPKLSLQDKDYLLQLINAKQTQQAAPLYRPNYNKKLSLKDAYLIQKMLLKNLPKGERIGFKAGLTNHKGQQKFQVDTPIAGIMYTHYLQQSGLVSNSVDLHAFNKPMLELELGFTLRKIPTQSITQVEQLLEYVDKVYPVIELPDLGFQKGQLTAADVVANNCAYHSLIVGKGSPVTEDLSKKINQLSVTLKHQGNTLIQGKGADALGNQLASLQWLVNHAIEQGYNLSKKDIFITGALGKMLPAQVGHYYADFEELGTIHFNVTHH